MKHGLSKDAKGFIEGVITHLRRSKTSTASFPKVRSLLRKVTSQEKNEGTALVRAPIVLTVQEKNDISEKIAHIVGRPVSMSCLVDPSVVGGMVITIGDWIVDTSIHGQLESISNAMKDSL